MNTDTPTPASKMTIWGLLRNLMPFVLPYRWLIFITLLLTLVGSLMAQVNAVVLDRAVDEINALVQQPGGFQWSAAVRILTIISIILNSVAGGSFSVTNLITGLILPVLFIIGAVLNKKSA